jgi:hypothetical protein
VWNILVSYDALLLHTIIILHHAFFWINISLYFYILDAVKLYSDISSFAGVLYFVSSTVNPILYNLLSRKFRYAFKRTFCRCCIDLDNFPTFYKLKAIFRSKNEPATTTPSGMRYIFPQKQVRMNTLYGSKNRTSSQQRLLPNNQQPTKDSLLKVSNGSTSESGSHAHSDGRLHYLCRHKSCSSNRTRPSIESQMFCKHFNNASCQDMETLRKLNYLNQNPLNTFDSVGVPENMRSQNKFFLCDDY